ncbi:hypothetical protein LX73_1631 [Fodinibius salinus]|uniref:Uncharacterized protein n=1 Tax=Fodinibius salinus TaxID=860790 RepID=A0A5D3YKA2_9BACT|nr:hypothetical protein LX73_1631 [Fodinibius salinus]
MKNLIIILCLYITYIIYYYFTRDKFLDKFIETSIIFGIFALGLFIYNKFFDDEGE